LMKDASGEETKMSKSLGNVLDPFEIIDKYGSDALRFYLLREVSFGQDGAVSVDGFVTRYESELANDFGNLASRSISMVHRYRDGVVAAVDVDPAIAAVIDPLAAQVADQIDAGAPSQALETIWAGVRRLNQYVEEQAPWGLAKDPEKAAELDIVLTTLVDGVRVIALLLHPFLPVSTEKLLATLADPAASEAPSVDYAGAATGGHFGHAIATLEPLFPKAI
ncbi:MAG: class I tRNA ligase family protein, partial [Patulibacter sp.]|nr:class I tRNA ligase family protein [Patulibacter sp.]